MRVIFGVALLLLLLTPAMTATAKALDCFPFVGEKMTFAVGWEFVTAGTLQIDIIQQGESGYRIHNFARTNDFFDLFKKVRDTLVSEGFCRQGKMQSSLFTTDQLERSYTATKYVEYLWQDNKVRYTKNNQTEMFHVPAGHLNVLDAFYLTRLAPPTIEKPLMIPIFDAGQQYDVTVKLLKRAKLRAPWGKVVHCLVVQPELVTEGVFSSVGEIKIWLTDDERRIPLKITAKIKIGHIVVGLTGYQKI